MIRNLETLTKIQQKGVQRDITPTSAELVQQFSKFI